MVAPVRRSIEPADGPLHFGRDRTNDLVLDPTDISVSRRAGAIEFADGQWSVVNLSSSRPLYTIDSTGLRLVLGVGQRRTIRSEEFAVVVVGGRLTHTIRLELHDTEPSVVPPSPTGSVDRTLVPSLSENEMLAVVALCEGYLLTPPRHSPAPRQYEDAAQRLGIPRSTFRKRIERVRQKLIDAGVVELEGGDSREGLCEFVLATSLVTREHLALLPT